jgi:hypothetical protein
MFIDIFLAELFKADHNFDLGTKNSMLEKLYDLRIDNEIYQSFVLLDEFSLKFEDLDTSVKVLTQYLNDNIKSKYGANRNSIYLFEDGISTPQLPSHYKFDRTIAKSMNWKTEIDKNNLFIPYKTNTIRIYTNTAVIIHKPSVDQIKTLLSLGIKSFVVKDFHTNDIFDNRIEKLPIFSRGQNV